MATTATPAKLKDGSWGARTAATSQSPERGGEDPGRFARNVVISRAWDGSGAVLRLGAVSLMRFWASTRRRALISLSCARVLVRRELSSLRSLDFMCNFRCMVCDRAGAILLAPEKAP